MKHLIEKPSDRIMKYFTPQLYQRFNSSNDEDADRANEEWEEAILAYNRQLDGIREWMPSPVRKLSELCLHDAELLSSVEEMQVASIVDDGPFPFPLPFWSALAVLTAKQDGKLFTLIYSLWDDVRIYAPPEDWRFSKLREHWLYDELDQAPERQRPFYLHRILLSTGRVVVIPFVSAVIHAFTLPAMELETSSKRSA